MSDLKKFEAALTDHSVRAGLVETFRNSAALLDGSGPALGKETQRFVSVVMSHRLRTIAGALCDHCRINSDGTCRYCETTPPPP